MIWDASDRGHLTFQNTGIAWCLLVDLSLPLRLIHAREQIEACENQSFKLVVK